MLDWLLGNRKRKQELPCYSGLRSIPNRGLPAELQNKEASELHTARRETIENQLLESTRRPQHNEPLFTALVGATEGVLTLDLPEAGRRCLPVFSRPIRAADYVQTLLNASLSVQYLCSTPLELAQMLHDLREARVETLALDRCPRCTICTTIGSDSIKTADDLVNIWAFKATELARANLYFEFAIESALKGQLEGARDVALETVGHVTMEDPRLHLLLGQLGVGLGDRKLVGEAKAFLEFLKLDQWEQKLDSVVRTGVPDFAGLH